MEMKQRMLADGLGWAEGPAVLPDGRVCFVETFQSRVSVWEDGLGVREYAHTDGGPNACVLGENGRIYVCQNGGTVGPWRADVMLSPSIQVIDKEGGKAEIICTEIEGMKFNGPNDLVFGPDGKLYFTDPGTFRPEDPEPSRIFVLDQNGDGRLLLELGSPTFPNGIAIEADGSVVWAESYTGMIRRLRLETGAIEDIGRLPGDKPVADGLAIAKDGRMFVTTVNGGGIDVLHPNGDYDQFIKVGNVPTNCVFHGTTLYLTDAGAVADTADSSYNGQLWSIETGVEGGPTWQGAVG